MSDVKYQLRRVLPSLSADAAKLKDAEVRSRYRQMCRIVQSTRSIDAACAREGKSSAWFYKWAKALLKSGDILSLFSKSRRPKRSPNQTPKRIVKRIKNLRKLEPFNGAERISRDLKDLFNMHCPRSTVNEVLLREGLITQQRSKSLTKKHLKRYRRADLGYLQMDFKYVPYLIGGQQYYQLSAVDHHSSWRFIRVYPYKDTDSTLLFLRELIKCCPFAILELQTDNDSAFTDKFTSQFGKDPTGLHLVDQWCERYEIRHRLIPPGVKELNGKVENTHKQDDREHFSQIHPRTLKGLELLTALYNERWNERRSTKALGWKTPSEVVLAAQVRVLTWLLIIKERYTSGQQPMVKMDVDGIAYIPLPKEKALKAQPRTTKKTAVDRYLQWSDWEEKSRKKA